MRQQQPIQHLKQQQLQHLNQLQQLQKLQQLQQLQLTQLQQLQQLQQLHQLQQQQLHQLQEQQLLHQLRALPEAAAVGVSPSRPVRVRREGAAAQGLQADLRECPLIHTPDDTWGPDVLGCKTPYTLYDTCAFRTSSPRGSNAHVS